MKFQVEDWAGNVMDWGTFPSFEAAWNEIMLRVPEDSREDYYAEEV